MKLAVVAAVVLGGLASLFADVPQDPAQALEWQKRGYANIDDFAALPPEQAIPKLGGFVRRLSMSNYTGEQKWPVIEEARQRLLAIPRHAEYYAGEIEKLVSARERTPVGLTEFNREVRLIFDTLSHMPSEQAVEVLGRYVERADGLPDFRAKTIMEWSETRPDHLKGFVPLWMLATDALHDLPIENAPRERHYPDGVPSGEPDREEWRKWTIRVKEGRLSYKFEGDDRIYPTGTKAPPYAGPKRGAPGSRDQVRNETVNVAGREGVSGQTDGLSAEVRRLWPWVVGIVVLAICGWWWLLRGKRK